MYFEIFWTDNLDHFGSQVSYFGLQAHASKMKWNQSENYKLIKFLKWY